MGVSIVILSISTAALLVSSILDVEQFVGSPFIFDRIFLDCPRYNTGLNFNRHSNFFSVGC